MAGTFETTSRRFDETHGNGCGGSHSTIEDSLPDNGHRPGFRRTSTRADLLDAVYLACPGLSRQQARDIFEMTLDEVSTVLSRGESVKLRAFGLFAVREKRGRVGRNPKTGEEAPIKPRRVLTFKASPVLLDHLNAGSRGHLWIDHVEPRLAADT